MNTHTASEHAAALKLQAKAASMAAGYDPTGLPGARLGLLMVAAELEAREQFEESTLMVVRNDLIKEAMKYTKTGADVPIDVGTTARLVVLLSNILEGYTCPFRHEVAVKESA